MAIEWDPQSIVIASTRVEYQYNVTIFLLDDGHDMRVWPIVIALVCLFRSAK